MFKKCGINDPHSHPYPQVFRCDLFRIKACISPHLKALLSAAPEMERIVARGEWRDARCPPCLAKGPECCGKPRSPLSPSPMDPAQPIPTPLPLDQLPASPIQMMTDTTVPPAHRTKESATRQGQSLSVPGQILKEETVCPGSAACSRPSECLEVRNASIKTNLQLQRKNGCKYTIQHGMLVQQEKQELYEKIYF